MHEARSWILVRSVFVIDIIIIGVVASAAVTMRIVEEPCMVIE
jgi:hypothetical protein